MTNPVEIPTYDAFLELAQTIALATSAQLGEKSFTPGYIFDVHTALPAELCEEGARIALELYLQTYLQTADGAALDNLIEDHFNLPRQGGVAAIGTVRFSRPAVTGNVFIEAGTQVRTPDNIVFQTTGAVILTGLQIDAPVEALVFGPGGNVDAGTITVLVTTLLDSTITVSNPATMAGGANPESDEEYRARAIGFYRTLRKGIVEALVYGASQVAGVAEAAVDESSYPPTVYIADVTGGSNTELITLVVAELDNWRAAGIQVNVLGATVVFQDVDLSLTFFAGFDTSEVRDLAKAAVVAEVNRHSIGEVLYQSEIVGAVKAVEGIHNVVVNDPAGDVVPAASEVLRTEDSRVTLS